MALLRPPLILLATLSLVCLTYLLPARALAFDEAIAVPPTVALSFDVLVAPEPCELAEAPTAVHTTRVRLLDMLDLARLSPDVARRTHRRTSTALAHRPQHRPDH
jgi:hypothetical protein